MRTPLLLLAVLLSVGAWSLHHFRSRPISEEVSVASEVPEVPAPVKPRATIESRPTREKPSNEPVADGDSRFQLVWDLIADKRKEDAIELLREMIRKNPNDDGALTELGVILMADPTQAAQGIEALQKALEVNPENDRALGDLLFVEASPERKSEIMAKLKALQETNPESANLSAGLGRLHVQRRDFQSAVGYLERAASDPKFTETSLAGLIDAYREMGQPTRSIDAYERLIAEQERKFEQYSKTGDGPRDLESRIISNKLGLASALVDSGQLDNAEKLLQQVRDRDPQSEALAVLMKRLSQKRAG